MISIKKTRCLFCLFPLLVVLGCQTAMQFSMPMTPSVSALAIEPKSKDGKDRFHQEKKYITNHQTIRNTLAILEKYKDQSKLRTFDFSNDFDFSLSWQIKETGRADDSQVYLSLKQPAQLTYSIKNVDGSRLTYVVTMSAEDQKELWTLLEMNNE